MNFSQLSTDERELLTGAVQIAVAERVVAAEIAARIAAAQVKAAQLFDTSGNGSIAVKLFNNLN